MEKLTDKIAQFLYSNTSWIFFSSILTLSIVVIVDGVDKDVATWLNYAYTAIAISLLFLPVLLFSWLRNKLRIRLSSTAFSSLWLFVFVVYPILLWLTRVAYYLVDPKWDGWFILILGFVFLLVELAIKLSSHDGSGVSLSWMKQLGLEKTILLAMIPLALVGVEISTGIQDEFSTSSRMMIPLKFIYYGIQFYLIIFIYYLFYWLNHYVLINRVFKEKGLIYYIIGFISSLIFLYPIASQLIAFLPIVQDFKVHPVAFIGVFDTIHINIPLIIMLVSIPFVLSFQWLKLNNEVISLEKEKSETELSLLKQQINPHFFFNTLNNLYAMSITKDERTPEVILQLSELMRYVIYQGKKKFVRLNEEIKHIEDYIQLQQIRLHKQLDYSLEKNIGNEQLAFPPLLFIILVENAFKHGIELAENSCSLKIKIESNDESLLFQCVNSVEENQEGTTGIGLDNLRKRLAFLYPNQHQLEINKSENYFDVSLRIKLI